MRKSVISGVFKISVPRVDTRYMQIFCLPPIFSFIKTFFLATTYLFTCMLNIKNYTTIKKL